MSGDKNIKTKEFVDTGINNQKELRDRIVAPDGKIYTDTILTCEDCGIRFLWPAGEQQYFSERNLDKPKRCGACRMKRRLAVKR